MRRLGLIGSIALSLGLVACGSDSTSDGPVTPDAPIAKPDAPVGTPDAKPPDARLPDALVPDAPPVVSGTIAVHDISLVDIPTAGHGLQFNISFSQDVPSLAHAEPTPKPAFPCSADSFDVTNPAMVSHDIDEGSIQLTVTPTAGSGPPIPPCTFQSSTGSYQCIGGTGAASIAPAAMNAGQGVLTLTDGSAAFTAAQVGRYVILTSGAAAGAAFPIGGASGTALAVANLPMIAQGFPITGNYIIAAGIGPVPFTANTDGSNLGAPPELLNDTDSVGIVLTKGGHQDFTYSAPAIAVGANFKLSPDTITALNGTIDLSGAAPLTIGCSTDTCNETGLFGMVVVIDSTDNPTSPATGLGTPVAKRATLTCSALAKQVVIPGNLLKVIGDTNPKKLRISVFHDGFDISTAHLNVVAGHGIIKFKGL